MKRAGETWDRLQAIAVQIRRHTPREGEVPTIVPGVTLYRAGGPTFIQRGVLRPSFCVVVQGEKVAHAGTGTELRYRPPSFVATSIDMPIAGQVVGATPAKPYLAVSFELSPADVLQVLRDAKIRVEHGAGTTAAFVGTCDARLLEVVLRAVTSLDDADEAAFMAPLLRKELIYRLVTGPSAAAFCQSALLARPDDGVGRAVDWIKTHFKDPLSIPALAKQSNMSTSSLQHKFKASVMMGPLQYQKRLRLEEARRLLLGGLADATSAALDVGYESPSQFTREYRRLFGLPPLRDLKRLRSEVRTAP